MLRWGPVSTGKRIPIVFKSHGGIVVEIDPGGGRARYGEWPVRPGEPFGTWSKVAFVCDSKCERMLTQLRALVGKKACRAPTGGRHTARGPEPWRTCDSAKLARKRPHCRGMLDSDYARTPALLPEHGRRNEIASRSGCCEAMGCARAVCCGDRATPTRKARSVNPSATLWLLVCAYFSFSLTLRRVLRF